MDSASDLVYEENVVSSLSNINKDKGDGAERKLPLQIWVFSICILALIALLLTITIILISNFTCVSIHLKSHCREGFCIEASRYTVKEIEENVVYLAESKVESLVVKYSDYVGKTNEKIVHLVNGYGIGFLFEIDFSAGVVPFEIINNGYIIVGQNLDAIKAYDWEAIKKNQKILESSSCAKVCIFVKIVTLADATIARTEEFVKNKSICGLYYENSMHPDLETNPESENMLENTSIISFSIPVQTSESYRPYGHVKSSLSLSYTHIENITSNKPFLFEVYRMRRKLFMSFSNNQFNNFTLPDGQIIYLKTYKNTFLGSTFDVVLLNKLVTKDVNIQDIVASRRRWSFLLGPSGRNGDVFDVVNTAHLIQRTDQSEFCVVALY